MYLLLCIFALALYWPLNSYKNQDKAKRAYIYIMTFVLCLFSAIRHLGVGVDTYQYYLGFTSMEQTSWNYILKNLIEYLKGDAYISDPGFTLYTKLFASICNNFYIYNFIIAYVFISAVGRIIYKSVNELSGYVLCYGYYISLMYYNCPNNLTRQTLGMGLLLWATIFIIEKRKRFYSILLILIAVTIHRSSLLGLLPIVLLYIGNVRIVYILGVVIMPFVMLVGPQLVSILALNSAYDRYLIYVDMETETKPIVYIVEMLVFYLIGLYRLKHVGKQNQYVKESYKCFAMAIALVSLLWVSSDMIRITYYFSVWGIPFVAESVQLIGKSFLRKVAFIMVLFLLIGRVALSPSPYKFYWEKMELHDRYLYY